MTDKELEIAILEILNDIPRLDAETNITLADDDPIYTDEYNTTIIEFWGGLNGSGNWSDYLRAVADIIDDLNALPEISDAYVVEWTVDCADDIFTLLVGVSFDNSEDNEQGDLL